MRSARDLGFGDLVWSHFSRPRSDDLEGRLAAASAAGMAGIGLFVGEWARLRDDGWSLDRLVDAFGRHGQVLHDVEAFAGWWAPNGPDRERCAQAEELAYELTDALDVRYLQAIGSEREHFDLDVAADGFGAFCDRAGEHGLLVGIEWMPFTNLATSADARHIVEAADRANGGYCLDLWHHRRGGEDDAVLDDLDADRIFLLQLNDGPAEPQEQDLKRDCLLHRLPPGEGEFGVGDVLRRLRERGVDAPISLEVPSAELWAARAGDAARAVADATRTVLAAL